MTTPVTVPSGACSSIGTLYRATMAVECGARIASKSSRTLAGSIASCRYNTSASRAATALVRGFKCATLKAQVRIILLRCERKQSLSGDPLQIDLSLICSSGLLFELSSTPAGTPQLGEWGNLLGSVNGPGTYFGDQSPNLLGNCPNLEQVRNNVYIRFASHDRNHCY